VVSLRLRVLHQFFVPPNLLSNVVYRNYFLCVFVEREPPTDNRLNLPRCHLFFDLLSFEPDPRHPQHFPNLTRTLFTIAFGLYKSLLAADALR
jgi:hypothetical protein